MSNGDQFVEQVNLRRSAHIRVAMETKMKGLFKGLRYISQIFDNQEEKEAEMQIGFPTDVKHVAHIGCDGASANSTPGWMNEYRSAPQPDHGNRGGSAADPPRNHCNSSDPNLQDVDSSSRKAASNRKSRRNQSSTADSRSRDAPEGSKQGRKTRSAAGVAADQSGADPTAEPKQPRRRKAKSSTSGEGSTNSSSGAKKADRWALESGAE